MKRVLDVFGKQRNRSYKFPVLVLSTMPSASTRLMHRSKNLQQLDVMVAGPNDANHLFVIDGQFDASLTVGSQGTNFAVAKETFGVLLGPSSLIDSSFEQLPQPSIAKTQMFSTAPGAFSGTWDIIDVDADWDDESEQVELRIEAQVSCSGSNPSASINGFAFHITILAALPAG